MKHTFKMLLALMAVLFAAVMSGCAAMQVGISKRDLDVQTKMSNTIFLDPVAADKRTVYIQARNTSDKPGFTIDQGLKQAVAAKGYRLVNDPGQAHYLLQVNILQVGKTDQSASEAAFRAGYGGVLAGAAVGGLTSNNSGRGVVAGGLLGGIAETVAGAMVKDVYYSAITDIQISERMEGGKTAKVTSEHKLAQGTSGAATVSTSGTSNRQRYQTRVLSSANKVNLEFAEAEPELIKGLTTAISGMF